jgi:hypothetical protein
MVANHKPHRLLRSFSNAMEQIARSSAANGNPHARSIVQPAR